MELYNTFKGRESGHLHIAAWRESRTAAVYNAKWRTDSISSRQHSAISGRHCPQTDYYSLFVKIKRRCELIFANVLSVLFHLSVVFFKMMFHYRASSWIQ